MNIFFTSDEHYHHTNIIKFCKRPFAHVDEMNANLISEHNAIVGKEDLVYHLGDFTFRSPHTAATIFRQLNGRHFFIGGNHDSWLDHKSFAAATDDLFASEKLLAIKQYEEVQVVVNNEKHHIVLFHFPLLTWHWGYKGSIMLHGHTHSNIDQKNKSDNVKRFDVGVDSAASLFGKYRPFRLEEVIEMASKRVNNTLDFGKE